MNETAQHKKTVVKYNILKIRTKNAIRDPKILIYKLMLLLTFSVIYKLMPLFTYNYTNDNDDDDNENNK